MKNGKLTKADVAALEEAVEKYRGLVHLPRQELALVKLTTTECKLCQLYYKTHPELLCKGCPISNKTGKALCGKTPYYFTVKGADWCLVETDYMGKAKPYTLKRFRQQLRKMADFMQKILDETPRTRFTK